MRIQQPHPSPSTHATQTMQTMHNNTRTHRLASSTARIVHYLTPIYNTSPYQTTTSDYFQNVTLLPISPQHTHSPLSGRCITQYDVRCPPPCTPRLRYSLASASAAMRGPGLSPRALGRRPRCLCRRQLNDKLRSPVNFKR